MEIRKEIKRDGVVVKCIAEDNGQAIGRIYLYLVFNDLHKEPYGLLEDLFVAEKYRRQGVARQLMDTAMAEARNYQCYKIICTSRYNRSEIHAWYQKLGFTDYGKEFRMDLVYEKK